MQSHPDNSAIDQTIRDIETRQVTYVIWHTSHSSVGLFLSLILGSAYELIDVKAPMSSLILALCLSSAAYTLVHQFIMHKRVYFDDKTISELLNKLYQS